MVDVSKLSSRLHQSFSNLLIHQRGQNLLYGDSPISFFEILLITFTQLMSLSEQQDTLLDSLIKKYM